MNWLKVQMLFCLAMLGCESANPTGLYGNPGARFFALPLDLDGDGQIAQHERALTLDQHVATWATTINRFDGALTLPVMTMKRDCAEKLMETDDVGRTIESVHLVELDVGVGVVWAKDGKVLVKKEVRVEGLVAKIEDRGKAGEGVTVNSRVGLVHKLTNEQMKQALRWFVDHPCATPEGRP